MLEVVSLRAGYGPVEVLRGIDLWVAEGELVAVLGANGAGKTTLLRSLAGSIARQGTVRLRGKDVPSARPDALVRLGFALVPQGRGTFADLTVEENLRVGGLVRGASRSDLDPWYELFPVLAARRQQRAGTLSGGEQQMLAIARALMSRPAVLLCDEPSLGLAPIVTAALFDVLDALRRDHGTSVLVVEQNAAVALDHADRAYVLESGRVVASGDAAAIERDGTLQVAYLGASR